MRPFPRRWPEPAEKKNLLLLDFTSETNLGDLALQDGLIRLVRQHYPDASLAATVIYGANQAWEHSPHFTELQKHEDVAVSGSLRPTFYPLRLSRTDPLRMEIRNAAGMLAGVMILLLIGASGRLAERVLPARFARTCRLIREADFVLWKGKNFRGTKWLIEPYRVLSRLITPVACLLYRKPIFNVSSSVWPLNNPLSTVLLRAVLRRCAHISVRESASLAQVERLLAGCPNPPTVARWPDLAFALLRDRIRPHRGSRRSGTEGLRFALTLMDWPGPGTGARERYIRAIVAFIEYVAADPASSFRIVPQAVTPWEAADYVVERVLDSLAAPVRERVSVVRNQAGIPGLLDEYAQADYLIGTRMHSAIFALSVGTPAVAIACDKGAKWQILADMGYGDFVIPYDEIGGDRLIARFEALRAAEDTVMAGVYDAISAHCRDVAHHVAILERYMHSPPSELSARPASPTSMSEA